MAKILLFSDIHVHPHKRKHERLLDCLKALRWVFEQAVERQVDAVLFGGDLLHERQKIDSFTYTEVFKILENYKDCNFSTYLLLGNHDMWFSNSWSVNSIYPFGSLKNFTTIIEPKELAICDSTWQFLPYTHNPFEDLQKLPLDNRSNKYLLGHLSIDGAKLNSAGSVSDVSVEHDGDMVKVDRSIFKDYKHAYFGHYHGAQKLAKNVEYIGSPLQLSFGEAGEEKHIIILDTNKNSQEYIVNDFSPKHFYIDEENLDSYSREELEKSFVCIVTKGDLSTENKKTIENKISGLGIDSVKLKTKSKEVTDHIINDAKLVLSDENKIIEKYVEQVQADNLQKDILIGLGKKIAEYESAE